MGIARHLKASPRQYTEEQLRTVLDFAQRSVAVAAEEAARIRSLPAIKSGRSTRRS